MGDLIIEKSAKNTEIMLAYFLHKKIYQEKTLRVGDGQGKFPDIRTDDLSLGIEAVQAEYAEDFASKIDDRYKNIMKKYIIYLLIILITPYGISKKLNKYIKGRLV